MLISCHFNDISILQCLCDMTIIKNILIPLLFCKYIYSDIFQICVSCKFEKLYVPVALSHGQKWTNKIIENVATIIMHGTVIVSFTDLLC